MRLFLGTNPGFYSDSARDRPTVETLASPTAEFASEFPKKLGQTVTDGTIRHRLVARVSGLTHSAWSAGKPSLESGDMENRGTFQGQTQPEWFIAIGEKSVGPMSAPEVYERVVAGELTWISYAWKEGMGDWARLCDIPTFQSAVPPPPVAKPKAQPPAMPTKKIQPKVWFLFFNESQHGPFSEDEIEGMLGAGKANGETFVWKDGMSDWERLDSVHAFSTATASATHSGSSSAAISGNQSRTGEVSPAGSEKRLYSRKPLLAKIMIVDGDQLLVGMARDVSVGGMQVLSEFVPSKVGSKLKLNISPSDPANPSFLPFVAEGLVVRLHEDRRGFSFRFEELSSSARQIIERILQG
ncbi:MAG: DUF4339 domain-containing protein [Cryobacterium sp.]|nr:DUF4339 domain-containing protein [Oligoflexia bacterium]